MNYQSFVTQYPPVGESEGPFPDLSPADIRDIVGLDVPSYGSFMRTVGRSSFGRGIIHFFTPTSTPSISTWNGPSGWSREWTRWRDRLFVIGYDWLGRQIAFDRFRMSEGEPLIAILEPGTAEVLEVPETFFGFATREAVNFADAALAIGFFRQWLAAGGAPPRFGECIGYRIPLFLGGVDEIENLELSDLEVYVSVMGGLAGGARN